MSEDARPAKLQPIDQSSVKEMVAALTAGTSLEEAHPRLFWVHDEPLNRWGSIKVATELEWWLSGAVEGEGADYVLRLNKALWDKSGSAGRRFLLDHYLSQVRAKEGGQTVMETDEGERQLFETVKTSLGLDPVVVARHPEGIREIDEVYRLHQALSDPAQFCLDLEAAEKEEEPEEGERPPSVERTAPPEPVHYYERKMLAELGPAILRYGGPDLRLSDLTGVHYLADAASAPAVDVDLGTLTYQDKKPALTKVRQALEAERAEWEAKEVAHAASLDEGAAAHAAN